MAQHYWNSTPPKLWTLARIATERGWTVTIARSHLNGDHWITCMARRECHEPLFTAVWLWHPQQPPATVVGGGAWRFDHGHHYAATATTDDPDRCTLTDIRKLILRSNPA